MGRSCYKHARLKMKVKILINGRALGTLKYIKRDINFNVPEEYNYESHQSCLSYFAGLPLALNYGVLHHFKLGINIEPRIDVMEIDRSIDYYFSISYGILLGIEY